MRTIEQQVGAAPRLDIRVEAGDVSILVGRDGHMEVELDGPGADELDVDASEHGIVVRTRRRDIGGWRGRRTDVRAVVPAGARVNVGTASGDVSTTGRLAEVQVSTASGDTSLDTVGQLALKAASGDVSVTAVDESAEIKIASGDVRIGSVRSRFECTTASGDVRLREADGRIRVSSASGDVIVERMLDGRLEVRTMGGDTTVGIPPRRKVSYDLSSMSGSVHVPDTAAPADGGPTEGRVDIRVSAVSGSLHLRRVD